MLINIMIAALMSAPVHFQDSTSVVHDSLAVHDSLIVVADTVNTVPEEAIVEMQVQEAETPREGYWKRKKYNRISYNLNNFSTMASDEPFPLGLSIGFDKGRNIYLHKKPIAGIMKFGIDLGIDLNYMQVKLSGEPSEYEGPVGYVGTEGSDYDDSMDFLADISGINFSAGLAVGPSLTINPVDKVRLCAYVHFVPTASFYIQGMSINCGYAPMMKYGLEASYGAIGLGIEYNSGMITYQDMIKYASVKGNGGDVSTLYKSRYFLESTQVYVAFRFGKK